MTAVRAAISTRTWALGSIALICCHRNRRVLRRAQVTHGFFLVHRPDHHLVQHAVAPSIELNRLADVRSFFSIVLSSEVTFRVNLPRFASAFFSCRLTVETGWGFAPLNSVNS